MTKEDFRRQFIELINILFSMSCVHIAPIYTPNGEIIDVYVGNNHCHLACHHGSVKVYQFHKTKKNKADTMIEEMDHISFLTSYLYYENKTDMDRQKIINSLRMEAVKQI